MPQKSKFTPGLAAATALLILIFTHLPAFAQRVLAYIGAGAVVAALAWGMWRFRANRD
jgi:uncharacterized BrkB/YihY/UPF0761 family membrane protein